jgi:predicted DNA-binding transcriptional regulator AlpA
MRIISMKIELENQDLDAIAQRIIEFIKPFLAQDNKHLPDNEVIDITGLSEYLQVNKKWIYEQTSLKRIPHFKLSNKQLRFRKREIDTWLATFTIPVIDKPMKLRLIK